MLSIHVDSATMSSSTKTRWTQNAIIDSTDTKSLTLNVSDVQLFKRSQKLASHVTNLSLSTTALSAPCTTIWASSLKSSTVTNAAYAESAVTTLSIVTHAVVA